MRGEWSQEMERALWLAIPHLLKVPFLHDLLELLRLPYPWLRGLRTEKVKKITCSELVTVILRAMNCLDQSRTGPAYRVPPTAFFHAAQDSPLIWNQPWGPAVDLPVWVRAHSLGWGLRYGTQDKGKTFDRDELLLS
jgi:hypothetical protein